MSQRATRETVLFIELGWRVLNHLEAENAEAGDRESTIAARAAAVTRRARALEAFEAPTAEATAA